MSKLTSYSLWGKFFILEQKLQYTDTGYEPLSGQVFRQANNDDYFNYFDIPFDTDLFVELSSRIKLPKIPLAEYVVKEAQINNPLEEIDKILDKKITVWEFNFDEFSIYSAKKTKSVEINIDNLISQNYFKKYLSGLGIDKNSFVNIITAEPLFAHDFYDYQVNSQIFKYYSSNLDFSLSNECDILVLTGEMIWSNWLDTLMLILLIQKNVKQNIEIIFDFTGYWELLLRANNLSKEVFKFSEQFFRPDLTYFFNNPLILKKKNYHVFEYKDDVVKKSLLISKNRSELFDLGNNDCAMDDGKLLTRYVLFSSKQDHNIFIKFSENKFMKWWKPIAIDKSRPAFKTFIFPENHITEKTVTFVLSKLKNRIGDKVKPGDNLGAETIEVFEMLDYRHVKNLSRYLVVVDGQIVRTGELIAKIPQMNSIITYEIKSPLSGRIDLKFANKGLITLHTNKIQQDYILNFEAKVTNIRRDSIIDLKTECMIFFAYRYTEQSASGVLRTSIKTIDPETANILFYRTVGDCHLSLGFIIKNRIRALIFGSASYVEFEKFLQRSEIILSGIAIVLLSEFEYESAEAVIYKIESFQGYSIFIENDEILIPQKQFQNKFYMRQMKEHEQFKLKEVKLKVGQKGRILNYFNPDRYARINSLNEHGVILLYNGKLVNFNQKNINIFYNE